MMISAILAMSENHVIGYQNRLPWHLPADLKHFKKLTLGKSIVMGRKTYLSIGKPLSERHNIILTRDKSFEASGCEVFHSIEDVLALKKTQEIMIIGGSEIFNLFLPHINRIYLTLIHAHIEGDTFFPTINVAEWTELSREKHTADANNPYDYDFILLEKK